MKNILQCNLDKLYSNRLLAYALIIVSILFSFGQLSCKKLVEIDQPNNIAVNTTVFTNDQTAESAINGVYSEMINQFDFASGGFGSVTVLAGLSADELNTYAGGDFEQFHTNTLLSNNASNENDLWGKAYKLIYYTNAIIEGVKSSTGMSEMKKSQLESEARFIRSFCYFYLINLYGNIPLVLSTDYRINLVASNTDKSVVYDQILEDLIVAQNNLSDDYSLSDGERIRPNRWAAVALLARVYLYKQDWSNAELHSTLILENSTLYALESDLNNVFLKNSNEAIWQLRCTDGFTNTREGEVFILEFLPYFAELSNNIVDAFDSSDTRKSKWIGTFIDGNTRYYFSNKYKVIYYSDIQTEYSMVLRLGEQYLIRSEARAHQDNIIGAQEDLNVIRTRAGLGNIFPTDQSSMLLAIESERKLELFTEWGHRWMDLKRTNRVGDVLSVVKAGVWHESDKLYPIPSSEILRNKNLVQNEGY